VNLCEPLGNLCEPLGNLCEPLGNFGPVLGLGIPPGYGGIRISQRGVGVVGLERRERGALKV